MIAYLGYQYEHALKMGLDDGPGMDIAEQAAA
jgi:hypothetical protein